VRRVNLFNAEFEYEPDSPAGYRSGSVSCGPLIGASRLSGKLYEIPPGQSICPYHYELGDEEWLLVLEGRPSVRHPEGEERLAPGDTVCFPAGPVGAHMVANPSDETVRALMFSTRQMPAVVIYPDSDKLGVFTDDERDDLMVRRSDAVGYWQDEPAGDPAAPASP
jgi:uncharacterized cupin superfamily protein